MPDGDDADDVPDLPSRAVADVDGAADCGRETDSGRETDRDARRAAGVTDGTGDEGDRTDDHRPAVGDRRSIARRRLLAVTGGVGLGALAGCGGNGDGGDDGTTPGATGSTPAPTTATPSETDEPSTAASTTRITTTVAEGPPLVTSPGSALQPTDGFASADWLREAEEEPQILRVTNLDPEGEGSLRDALATQGPAIIVFEVGGVIDFRGGDGIHTLADQLFVAGQTAPSPGITVIGAGIGAWGTDAVFQHLRVRVGDETANEAPDTMNVGPEASNVIYDHCSVSWSIDENMSTSGSRDCNTVTFSNNLIAEALRDSIHPKGPHSMGSLILNDTQDVTVFGNAYVSNENRNPRLKGGTTTAVVNNLVYNFNRGGMLGGEGRQPTQASYVGNHYIAGPSTDPERPVVFPRDDADTPTVHAADNTTEPSSMPVFADRIHHLDEPEIWPGEALDPMPAAEVYDHNMANAGARPADRSPHDERILRTVTERNGAVIDSQSEVGGYPDLAATERTLDPPAFGDGLAEWLRQHTRAVELADAEPP